jgi:hypothetical protein
MTPVEHFNAPVLMDPPPPRSQSCTLPKKVPKLNLSSVIPRGTEKPDDSFVQIHRSFSTGLVTPELAKEPSLHLLLQKGTIPLKSETTSLSCPSGELPTEKNDVQVYS